MGVRADAYESLIRASFPPHLFTPNALAFYRGLCMVAERIEENVDATQAQAFIDTATGIWLRVMAWERQVPYNDATTDEALRELLRKTENTITPNGMEAAVLALATYGDVTWTDPDRTARPAEYFEPWHDGGYLHSEGDPYDAASAWANAMITGPEGTASFEWVLPGLDLEGGSYLHNDGTGVADGSAFLNDTSFPTTLGAFWLTQPDYAAWDIVNQIAASLNLWRAYGVPAYAQLRPTADGGVPDPFFREGLAHYSVNGTATVVTNDPQTDILESEQCVYVDATLGTSGIRTGSFAIDETGGYRVGVTARSTLTATSKVHVKLKNVTRNEWWDSSTRGYVAGETGYELSIAELRDRQDPLILVPIAAGDTIQITIELQLNTIVAVYHVGMYKEPA